MNVTNADAKQFGLELRNELYSRDRPWPTMDQCIVMGFIEARQRLLDDLRERYRAATVAGDTALAGWAFSQAIEELERISQPIT